MIQYPAEIFEFETNKSQCGVIYKFTYTNSFVCYIYLQLGQSVFLYFTNNCLFINKKSIDPLKKKYKIVL